MLNVIYTKEKQTINVNYTYIEEEVELETFSLDNTKAELQAELVHRGIEFNQKDNKTELLEKLK